jgi:hypothetical protein
MVLREGSTVLAIIRKSRHIFVLALGLAAALGCNSKSKFKFDCMDILPAEEELNEFPLGQYKVPVPLADTPGHSRFGGCNRLQFDFELFALVSPKEQSQFNDAWTRHEGVIRDRVIDICRRATAEELMEPELSTLKARLTDALASQLGERRLRQLLINNVVSQEL